MVTQTDLTYSLLALQAYNAGSNTVITGIDGDLGNATVIAHSSNPSSGFSAVAFDLDGATVISFRGTDPDELVTDAVNGYGIGAGISAVYQQQALDALSFYQTIVGGDDLDAANVVLTGHSLGGGLAGYVASVYGDDAYIFDAMPFTASAVDDVLAAQNGDTDILSALYPDALSSFSVPDVDDSHIVSLDTYGQFLETIQTFPTESLDSNMGATDPVNVLHSMALQVDLEWAALDETRTWAGGASDVLGAYFGDDVATGFCQTKLPPLGAHC